MMHSVNLRCFYGIILIAYVKGNCPQDCVCEGDTMSCVKIPDDQSILARKLFLHLENLDNIGKTLSVRSRGLETVRELDISAGTCTKVEGMPFLNLVHLQVLGLHVKSECLFDERIFSGLNDLKVLNLSGNTRMYLDHLTAPLLHTSARGSVLPNMTSVLLDGIQSRVGLIYLKKSNLDALVHKRPLKTVEISSVNVRIADDPSIVDNVCTTIEKLVVRDSIFLPPKLPLMTPCATLRILDITGIFIPITNDIIDNADMDCLYFYLYLRVTKLMIKNVFKLESSSAKTVQGIFNLSTCELRLQYIDASFNTFKTLSASVFLHDTTAHSLSVLDFSHNIIQYISPNFLNPSRNLEILNISSNQLGYMQRHYPLEFEILFANLSHMRVIILSSNNLSHIPSDTFVYNRKLQEVDLNDNKLSSIAFKLTHLHDLKLFNVSGNLLQTIDELSFIFFSSFRGRSSGTSRFQFDLTNNKLVCSCSDFNRKFIRWLSQSPSVSKGTYKCTQDNKLLDIRDNAVEYMNAYCEREKSLRTLLIAGPLALALSLTVVIAAMYFIRRQKKKERLNNSIQNVQNGGIKNRLIFLCHCSEDRHIADKIIDRLNREMNLMIHVDIDYVSLGDRDFRPGFPVLQEAIRNIRQSKVVVCIVSNRFCQKRWCQMEVREAKYQKKPVIMIMVERVEKRAMDTLVRDIFEQKAHASWTNGPNGGEMKPDWSRFCKSVLELASDEITRRANL